MEELLKIIQLLGIDECIKYLMELPLFYISPIKSFRLFFSKPIKDKLRQSTFYVVVGILFILIFLPKLQLIYVVKIVIVELLAIVLLPLLAFAITDKVIFKIGKQKAAIVDLYLFLVLSRLLLYPTLFIAYALFIRLENYHFLFVFNVLFVLFIFLQWFGAIFFLYRPKVIPLTLVVQFVIFNIFMFLVFAGLYFVQTTSERTLDFELDPVFEEFNSLNEVLHPFADHNIIKVTFMDNKYAFNFAIDSGRYEQIVTSKKIPLDFLLRQTDSIGKQLHNDIRKYDSLFLHIRYETNRKIFQPIKQIDSIYLSEINTNERSIPTNDSVPILFKRCFFVSTTDSNKLSYLLFFSFSLKLTRMRLDYINKHWEYVKKVAYAYYPLNAIMYSTFLGFIPEETLERWTKEMNW